MEDLFQVRDVEKRTGIHSELIREYTRALELNGYIIARTPQGTRKYTQDDMNILKELYVEKLKNPGNVNEVAAFVIQRYKANTPAPPKDVNVAIMEQNQKFEEFMDRMHILAEQNIEVITLNKNLLDRHKEQEEKIEELMDDIERRANKRDEQLIKLIRDLQESKRQVAASQNKKWFSNMKSLFVKD